MNSEKKKRLAHSGWTAGDSTEFLQLTPEESSFVELKLALATGIREMREKNGMTQIEVAEMLGSSQSRVAKMEAGDRSVSLDLLIRTLLRIGAGPARIAKLIRRADTHRAA